MLDWRSHSARSELLIIGAKRWRAVDNEWCPGRAGERATVLMVINTGTFISVVLSASHYYTWLHIFPAEYVVKLLNNSSSTLKRNYLHMNYFRDKKPGGRIGAPSSASQRRRSIVVRFLPMTLSLEYAIYWTPICCKGG